MATGLFSPEAIKKYMQDSVYQAGMYDEYNCTDEDGILNDDIDFDAISASAIEEACADELFCQVYFSSLDYAIDRYLSNSYRK